MNTTILLESKQRAGRRIPAGVFYTGYDLHDRALGAVYLTGLWEAIAKGAK